MIFILVVIWFVVLAMTIHSIYDLRRTIKCGKLSKKLLDDVSKGVDDRRVHPIIGLKFLDIISNGYFIKDRKYLEKIGLAFQKGLEDGNWKTISAPKVKKVKVKKK